MYTVQVFSVKSLFSLQSSPPSLYTYTAFFKSIHCFQCRHPNFSHRILCVMTSVFTGPPGPVWVGLDYLDFWPGAWWFPDKVDAGREAKGSRTMPKSLPNLPSFTMSAQRFFLVAQNNPRCPNVSPVINKPGSLKSLVYCKWCFTILQLQYVIIQGVAEQSQWLL
jgi:hypothetical protein